jgi:hypothetical protein
MRSVKNRRSLTPDLGVPAAGATHPVRRGGNRHELTERIRIVGKNLKMREGWALNVSRGGVRAILEESVELGEEYEVTIGEEGENPPLTRRGRVVWVQDEPDGVIVGFEFLMSTGAHPAVQEPSADGSGVAPAVGDPKPDD